MDLNYITTDEAAEILKCDRDYICFLIRTKQLEGAKVAGRYLTSGASIRSFFESGGEMKSRPAYERAVTKRRPGRPRKYPASTEAET